MHKYLRAIGFGQIKNRKQLQLLITDCIRTAKQRDYISLSEQEDFIFMECCKEFCEGMGIAVGVNLMKIIITFMIIIFLICGEIMSAPKRMFP